MSPTKDILIWSTVSLSSLGLHVGAFGGLAGHPPGRVGAARVRASSLVEMAVAPPKPPPQPANEPLKRPDAAKPMVRTRRAVPKPASQPLAPEAPPPQAETLADFTGVTLTNAGSAPGWSSATGNGEEMRGPIGTPGAKVTGRSRAGSEVSELRDAGPPIVGRGDLSRAPQSPDLAAALERFYPAEARRRGLAGKAVVRARVMPEGRLTELTVMSETSSGFGAACKQTLRGSQWTPPIDRAGRPVSTFIIYNCGFEVR